MFNCLACGGKMDVNKEYGKYQCVECGRFMDGTLPPEPEQEPKIKSLKNKNTESWVLGGLLYSGEISARMRSMVETLRFELRNGDREGALNTCERLLQMDRKFTDAHLWIAKLSDDPEIQKKHIDVVLAYHPGNAEATRILLMLRGELTEEEAKRSENLYDENIQVAEGTIEAKTDVLLCPICRGGLTIADDGHVECAFCGYQEIDDHNAVKATPETSLAVAMIKQRGKAVRWKVGERSVKCNECGAERVLPAGKMSGRCPFCNSSHVITQDTLGAFRQPDGIVKFRLKREKAEDLLYEQLESKVERLKGIFINNRVDRIYYSGVFLPYWVFDIFGKAMIRDVYRDASRVNVDADRQEIGEQLHNVAIPAVNSLAPSLTSTIADYKYGERIAYTPKLLSKFAAELYDVEFDKASLTAREIFRQEMEKKNPSVNPNTVRTVSTQVDYIEMELLLLPVWVATIIERDGDVRIGLVNGQTGRVALGKARKPTT